AALLGLAVEHLRDGGWASDLAQGHNLYAKFAAVVLDPHQVAHMNLARGFRALAVPIDQAKLARPRRKRTRLEETGCPEPFVDPHAGHDPILPEHSIEFPRRR